jgi:AraC-like DNA-binding protein
MLHLIINETFDKYGRPLHDRNTAQRILFYERHSVKELAYEIGFADTDYFSRLFKQHRGKSISWFVSYIQDLSSQK